MKDINWNSLLNLFLATHCILCGTTLKPQRRLFKKKSTKPAINRNKQYLCSACLADLPYLEDSPIQLSSIGVEISSGTDYYPELPFNYIYCEFAYLYPVNRMVTRLKFGKQLMYANILGNALAQGIKHNNIPLPDALLPVPLHGARLRKRGFNQALEIAKIINIDLQLPILTQEITRTIKTKAQSGLNFEDRQDNIKQAFQYNQPINHHHIAIVDDVVTTGSTLIELSNLLKNNGVKTISLWVCAHSSLHNHTT